MVKQSETEMAVPFQDIDKLLSQNLASIWLLPWWAAVSQPYFLREHRPMDFLQIWTNKFQKEK